MSEEKKENTEKNFKIYQKRFQRFRINGEFYEIDEIPKLDRYKKHDIEVLVDRIIINKSDEEKLTELKQRLADSIEIILNLSDGLLYLINNDTNDKIVFSSNFSCPETGFTIDEIEPRLFSFNNPAGACKECDGLGYSNVFTEELIIPNKKLSFREGVIALGQIILVNYIRKH